VIRRLLKIAPLFILFGLYAQENTTQSVYFDVDKYSLQDKQVESIINLIKSIEITKLQAVQIYGYCDDRGSDIYNDKLSIKRVETVKKILISNGITENKIVVLDGRGRVLIDKDTVKNLEKTRDYNRRVDVILIKKKSLSAFPPTIKEGDLIVLEQITFEMGSSVLTLRAKSELDRIVAILKIHKTLRFEIKGHVCCTSSKFSDAIDKETQNRNLSTNRAKNVFNYFRSKGISPYRMTYKGYGNSFPLGKGDEFDRRVEFMITKI
jgi:outer membrane protein OmpA-like peptidoglycan-associated protein